VKTATCFKVQLLKEVPITWCTRGWGVVSGKKTTQQEEEEEEEE